MKSKSRKQCKKKLCQRDKNEKAMKKPWKSEKKRHGRRKNEKENIKYKREIFLLKHYVNKQRISTEELAKGNNKKEGQRQTVEEKANKNIQRYR